MRVATMPSPFESRSSRTFVILLQAPVRFGSFFTLPNERRAHKLQVLALFRYVLAEIAAPSIPLGQDCHLQSRTPILESADAVSSCLANLRDLIGFVRPAGREHISPDRWI
jgi:hypothetical protein